MHDGLHLCRGARLHDAQQEAHKHGLHQVHLALHQGWALVRWWPSVPLRAPLSQHVAKATGIDGSMGSLKQSQDIDELFCGLTATQGSLPHSPSGAVNKQFPWPAMSLPLNCLSRTSTETLSWKHLLLCWVTSLRSEGSGHRRPLPGEGVDLTHPHPSPEHRRIYHGLPLPLPNVPSPGAVRSDGRCGPV